MERIDKSKENTVGIMLCVIKLYCMTKNHKQYKDSLQAIKVIDSHFHKLTF